MSSPEASLGTQRAAPRDLQPEGGPSTSHLVADAAEESIASSGGGAAGDAGQGFQPPREWTLGQGKQKYVLLSSATQAVVPGKLARRASIRDDAASVLVADKQSADLYVPMEWLKGKDPAAFGIARPPDTAGAPLTYSVQGANGRWVRTTDLFVAGVTLTEALWQYTIYCSWEAGAQPRKRAKVYAGAGEFFLSEHNVRSAFPLLRLDGDTDPMPDDGVYRFRDDTRPFIAARSLRDVLDEGDINQLIQDGKQFNPRAALFATVSPDHRVEACRAKTPTGFWFLDAALLASWSGAARERAHAACAPGALQPELPSYPVDGAGAGYVPMVVLRRVAAARPACAGVFDDEEPSDHLVARRVWPKDSCRDLVSAIRREDGTLSKVNGANAQGALMIPVARIEKHPFLRQLLPLVAPGHADLPIERSSPPKRNRAGGTRDAEYQAAKKSTVPMLAKKVITDPRALAILDRDVCTVSYMSRYGSLLTQLHLLRLLDESDGRLADDAFPVTDTFLANAMRFARTSERPSAVLYGPLAASAEIYDDDLSSLRVPFVPGIDNAVVFQARELATSALNSIANHGEARLRRVFVAAAVLEGVFVAADIDYLHGHVRDGTTLPALHPRLVALAVKYRALYLDKLLDGAGAFNVNALEGAQQQRRVARIYELFWSINRDLHELEKGAVATERWTASVAYADGMRFKDQVAVDVGAPEREDGEESDPEVQAPTDDQPGVWRRRAFALFPVNDLRRRHVRFDTAVWVDHLYQELYDVGVEGLQEDAFSSLFKGGDALKYREDASKLRSAKKGWVIGRSFTCNGLCLGITYYNPLRKASKADKAAQEGAQRREEQFLPMPKDAVRVGCDPGVKHMMTMAWQLEERGPVQRMTYTSKQHYAEGHIDRVARARERRVERDAKDQVEALSHTRRRTGDLSEFRAYVAAANVGHEQLWAVYGGRKAASERFEMFVHKTKSFDGFLRKLKANLPRGRPVVLGWGNARFNGSMAGLKPVPTSSMARRVKRTMGADFDLRGVDEFRTTKLCVQCHAELASGTRWRRGKGGTFGWSQDRDVKWCTTPSCLESHPCSASDRWLKGARGPPGQEAHAVDRDVNSAYAMTVLVGLPNEQRPGAYRRTLRGVAVAP